MFIFRPIIIIIVCLTESSCISQYFHRYLHFNSSDLLLVTLKTTLRLLTQSHGLKIHRNCSLNSYWLNKDENLALPQKRRRASRQNSGSGYLEFREHLNRTSRVRNHRTLAHIPNDAPMSMGQKVSGGIHAVPFTDPINGIHTTNRNTMTIFRANLESKHSQKQLPQELDYPKPHRLDVLLDQPPVSKEVAEKHAWSQSDRSLNIYVKPEDPFTLHRHPVAQSTDCIRAKMSYSRGLHVWKVQWNRQQRGTHAVIGVGDSSCALHCAGYTSLIGNNDHSWGWDIGRMKLYHDSKAQNNNCPQYPTPETHKSNFSVPDEFHMVLDMDEGTLSYVVNGKYLGVAFAGLKGKKVYPMVSAVWGHCEVSMQYQGGLEPEPLPLMDICRRVVRRQIGKPNLNPENPSNIQSLQLPTSLESYLLYIDHH